MRKKAGKGAGDDVNRMFERQQRRLNRKRLVQTLIGIGLLAAVVLALQVTPYRDLPRDIVTSGVKWVKGFFSGPGVPEPDPKYW